MKTQGPKLWKCTKCDSVWNKPECEYCGQGYTCVRVKE